MQKDCLICKQSFFVYPYEKDKRKYCSRKCMYSSEERSKKISLVKAKEKHHNWKGGIYSLPDYSKNYNKEYVEKNIDRLRIYRAKYYLANKEKRKKYIKEWGLRNIEKVRFYARNTIHKNRERNLDQTKKRRALMVLTGSFTRIEWEEIKKAHNYICSICKRAEPEIKLSIDHIIPIMRGGRHIKENIQPLCLPCNKHKGVKLL